MLLTAIDHANARERSAETYALAGLIGLALAMGVGRFAFTPLFPLIQSDAALSVAEGAWLAAANYFGYLVGALTAFGVHGRPSRLIRMGLAANALSTLGMGLTQSLGAWLALRGVAGVSSAFLLIFISALCLERLNARARPLLSAAVFSGVGAGIFTVGVLCLALERSGFSAAEIWIVLGVVSSALGLVVWPLFGDSPRTVNRTQSPQANARQRQWPLVACYALFGFGYIVPATFLPLMAKSAVGAGWVFGLSWPVFGLAAFVSTFVAAYASRLASGVAIWRVAQIVMAVGVALPALLPGLGAVIVAAICVGGTFMVITMVGMQTAKQAGARRPERLMAAMTAGFAAGQLAGPLCVSWVVTSSEGFSNMLLAAAAALLLGIVLLGRENRPPHAGAVNSSDERRST